MGSFVQNAPRKVENHEEILRKKSLPGGNHLNSLQFLPKQRVIIDTNFENHLSPIIIHEKFPKKFIIMAVQQQLSGTIVVIIIAMCVQVCIMLVIVVKRQIMRFALRNRRGPHTHVGQGAPKMLRREIDRQLDYVAYIRHEPEPVAMKEDNFDYRLAALKELR